MIFFALVSASSLNSSSNSVRRMACSRRTSVSNSATSCALASSADRPAIFCRSSNCSALIFWISSPASVFSLILRVRVSSFFSRASVFLSRFSSFWVRRRSWRVNSARRSFTSRSNSFLVRRISSRASRRTSFFLVSAALIPSSSIFLACSSAEPICFSAERRRMVYPAKIPIGSVAAAAMAAEMMMVVIGTPPLCDCPQQGPRHMVGPAKPAENVYVKI